MNKQNSYSPVSYSLVEKTNIKWRIGQISHCNCSKGNVPLWESISQGNPRMKLRMFTVNGGSCESEGGELGGSWCLWGP